MSRRLALGAGLLLGVLGLGACDQELPTGVGGEHLPESALRTYEILLDDLAFLAGDSLLRGFGTTASSPVLIVAEDYRSTLDAHGLVRFGRFPTSITYVDSLGTHTDTIARFIAGRIVVRMDTAALGLDTLGTDSTIAIDMYTLAESFDARTATWTARRIEAGDTTFWTTPGGTVDSLLGSGSWTRSDTIARDSMVFVLDSATVAAWAEGGPDRSSILLRTTTVGARAQVLIPRLELTVRVQGDADTTRAAVAVVEAQTYVYDPPPPTPVEELRVGDRSAWRSFLMFREGLDTVSVPCPDQPVGCSFTLGEVTVNRAELRLTALPVPEVYRPRGNFALEARPVLGGDLPLVRAPLGDTTGVVFRVTPAHFEDATDSIVTMPVTRFVRGLLAAAGDTAVTDRNRTLALLTSPEPLPFGIARFGGLDAGVGAPVLRLIVTLPPREEDE